jgi:putative flippase GtrA
MQKILSLFEKYGSLWRWALVGATTALIDYVIFISVYSVIISILIANFISGLVSLSFNYSAHYFWSFKSQTDHTKAALKYLINLISFWSISTLLLKILITSGFDPKIAKLIPIPIIAPLSFISLRFFVFDRVNNLKQLNIFGSKKNYKKQKPKN